MQSFLHASGCMFLQEFNSRTKLKPESTKTSSNQRLIECVGQDILYEKGKLGNTTNLVVGREIERENFGVQQRNEINVFNCNQR